MFLAICFADDAFLALRCPQQLQTSFDFQINLFQRVGLRINTPKSQIMTCVLGKIRTHILLETYNNSQEGLRTLKERQTCHVNCNICGQLLLKSTLPGHMEIQHNMFRSRVIDQDLLVECNEVVYNAGHSTTGTLWCPVLGCPGPADTPLNLWHHFHISHPRDRVCAPLEGLYFQCRICGKQVSPSVTLHQASRY